MSCESARHAVAGAPDTVPDREAAEHLLECDECRTLLVATSVLSGTKSWSRPPSTAACPGDERLAALAEGTLDRRRRDVVIAHAASCESCARAIVPMASDLEGFGAGAIKDPPAWLEARAIQSFAAPAARSARTPRSRIRLVLAGSAAVVLLAVGIQLYRDSAPLARRSAVLRGETGATVVPASPRGEAGRGETARFVWRETGPPSRARRYRLLVVDLESGHTIVEAVTTATSYTPSAEEAARFRPGAAYHWLVEPLDEPPAGPSETAVFRLSR